MMNPQLVAHEDFFKDPMASRDRNQSKKREKRIYEFGQALSKRLERKRGGKSAENWWKTSESIQACFRGMVYSLS